MTPLSALVIVRSPRALGVLIMLDDSPSTCVHFPLATPTGAAVSRGTCAEGKYTSSCGVSQGAKAGAAVAWVRRPFNIMRAQPGPASIYTRARGNS